MNDVHVELRARGMESHECGADAPCWRWLGGERVRADGARVLPQRFIFERALGPLPQKSSLEQACARDAGLCVQPMHQRIVHRARHFKQLAPSTHCRARGPLCAPSDKSVDVRLASVRFDTRVSNKT